MPAGYSFRPRPWALALAALGCAAFVALGNWQMRRADEKRAFGAQLEQAARAPAIEIPAVRAEPNGFILRRVAARGEFVAERTILLENKLRRGRPGYEVVTPFRLADGPLHVLVNRGWVEAPPGRDVIPAMRVPAGEIRIEGIAYERLPQALQLEAAKPQGKIRQNLDIAAFAAETGLALQPFVIEEYAGPQDGLLREWPRRDAGVERHESYALQWYSFAALAVILGLVLSFRKSAAAAK